MQEPRKDMTTEKSEDTADMPANAPEIATPSMAIQTAKTDDWQSSVPTSIKKPLIVGCLIMGTFIAGFTFWANKAPIAGAAIAPGVVVASGQNQGIQHLEGGIINEIAVKNGAEVKENQPLVYLDETQAVSDRNRIDKSLVSLEATLARSTAELTGAEAIEFPQNIRERASKSGNEDTLKLQEAEFTSRLQQHRSELSVLDEQVQAVNEELAGIQRQIEAEERKLSVIQGELKDKKKLLERGLTPKNQYNALLRSEADSQGAIGALRATIGQRKKAISEVRERQETLRATRKTQASAQINETSTQIEDLREQLTSRSAILQRMIIRAPVDGVIVKIEKNTIGSIIRPGETVLEILPTSNDLIISARVSPVDKDIMKIGQNANIRFSALNARVTPEVPATLEYISADRLIDEVTQEPYFDARLKLAENLPEEISKDQIYAGMPVEAFIKTEERTFVEYLIKPITDSFEKAFREE